MSTVTPIIPPQVDQKWLQHILDSADFTIISTDVNGLMISCNQGALERLGYKAEELIGIHTPAIIHDKEEVVRHAAVISAELGKTIEPGFEVFVAKARLGVADENEWSYIRKDGTRFPVLLSVTALKDDDGNIEGFLGIGRDISLRKAMEKKIELQKVELEKANEELLEANKRLSEIVQIDPLTQLLNRRGFHSSFEKEVERIKRKPAPLSLMLLDLDHFKQYNDQFGHLEGDHLLKMMSKLLSDHSRSNDSVARFGGEEFLLILPQTDLELSKHIAERYRKEIENMVVSNRPVTASIGVSTLSCVPEDSSISQLFDQIIDKADRAMYASKAAGRNRVHHFDEL